MNSDNWRDETVPAPRVRSGRGDGSAEDVRAAPTGVPIGVLILGGAVAMLALAVCGLWSLYFLRGELAGRGPTPTPIIWTPTAAPTPAVTPTPVPTEEPTPTGSPHITIGHYVQVAGTSGYGLSLREGPGENYARVDVALEGEVFLVVDGPTVAGGPEWWKIRDPENAEREWWAVGNFLEPVEHP